MFDATRYFDLTGFEHASLFEQGAVWEALNQISGYLARAKLGRILGAVHEGAYLVSPETISIGEGSVVEAGAYIQGPCIIGKGCQIRHGAYIRGNCIIGDRCVIGHATEVKHAIFFNGAHAAHFAYVGDSILGNRVNLGAGTKLANLRFDGRPISIYDGETEIETQMRKFGAVLGDDVQMGCNSVTNPGTVIGKKTCVGPCATVKGIIPENSIVKPAQSEIISSL